MAEILTEAIGLPASEVDLSAREMGDAELSADTLAIIAVPSFAGRVPATATERLKNKVHGNGAKAVLVAVYGNRAYEDTLVELYDIAMACGFKVVACVSAVARHSIVTRIAAQRPDEADRAVLDEFGKRIAEKIAAGDLVAPAIPGNRPYKKGGASLVPKTNDKCSSCGMCVSMCPVGAINPAEPGRIDGALCIGCMRCVSLCPVAAKFIPEEIVAAIDAKIKGFCADRKEPELFL